MKLSKVKFLEDSQNQELSKEEQKLLLGGYCGGSICFWISQTGSYMCTSSPDEAYRKAESRTWACNTQEAYDHCSKLLTDSK